MQGFRVAFHPRFPSIASFRRRTGSSFAQDASFLCRIALAHNLRPFCAMLESPAARALAPPVLAGP